MAATWTELWYGFGLAGNGWQNYDLYTNAGVPKGAIAHIVMFNANYSSGTTVGVRTDGSSLDRTVPLHVSVSTDYGVNEAAMYVKVDATTGLIETYANDSSVVAFYCSGYWTDIDFTEMASTITTSNTIAWVDWDVGALGVPDGRVCSVAVCNYDTTQRDLGIRTNGSSLTRSHTVHSSASTSFASTYTISVKSNSTDGYIEYYDNTSICKYMLLGYFDSTMDYQETVWTYPSSGTSYVWTDWDTGGVVPSNTVADIMCASARTFAYDLGARANGSTIERKWTEHLTEGYCSGECVPTQIDVNGIYEIMEYDYTYCRNGPYGYYMPQTSLPDYAISNSTTANAIIESGQRKVFLNQSLYWALYSDGTNMCISSSADGITWSNKTTVKAGITDGTSFAGSLNGNYLEVAYVSSDTLYYNKITLNSDGTVTLGTERSVLTSDATNKYAYPSITVDSNGRAIIGYRHEVIATNQSTTMYSPSGYSGTGWTNPANAYADGGTVATCSSRNVNTIWTTFGISGTDTIDSVRIRVDAYQASGGDDTITIAYTVNNSTYTNAGSAFAASNAGETTYWFDISATADTWSELSNTNFKVRITTARVGTTMSAQSLDWVATEVTTSTISSTYVPKVIKNNNTDGTWSAASGFPYGLSSTSDADWRVYPQAITAGKAIVIYGGDSTVLYAKGFDGTSTWGAEASTSTNTLGGYTLAVTPGNAEDVVYLAFRTVTTNLGKFIPFTYSTNQFGTVEAIDASATMTHVALTRVGSNFYAFYTDGTTLYYKARLSGTWDTNATSWQTDITSSVGVQCLITTSGDIIVLYGTGSSPYVVYDKILTIEAPPAGVPFSFCVFVG